MYSKYVIHIYLFNSLPSFRAKNAGIKAVKSAMYICVLVIPILITYFLIY